MTIQNLGYMTMRCNGCHKYTVAAVTESGLTCMTCRKTEQWRHLLVTAHDADFLNRNWELKRRDK